MLTGRLPYGAAGGESPDANRNSASCSYKSALDETRDIPAWIDGALKKAVHPDPSRRYAELSEFLFDLRHPNKNNLQASPRPLLERKPLLFWQGLSGILLIAVLILLMRQYLTW